MPVQGFEGPAGSGKTYRLMKAVEKRISSIPLELHQRVLAITFMHGARRRLDERLSELAPVRGRYICQTIDSFAGHLVQRWHSLHKHLSLRSADFDETCDACGCLLEQPFVCNWVTATYPVIVVDEAQELRPQRLRIVRALGQHAELFVAADEFQCLDEAIDIGPFHEWFSSIQTTRLTQNHRTSQIGLLQAAAALRDGLAPTNGTGFSIRYEYPNQMPFAVGHALNGARGPTAVIVAPGGTSWANTYQSLTQWSQQRKSNRPAH
jgi:superfamily I DNA/RNA helicase